MVESEGSMKPRQPHEMEGANLSEKSINKRVDHVSSRFVEKDFFFSKADFLL